MFCYDIISDDFIIVYISVWEYIVIIDYKVDKY